jgi:hypothetical protein
LKGNPARCDGGRGVDGPATIGGVEAVFAAVTRGLTRREVVRCTAGAMAAAGLVAIGPPVARAALQHGVITLNWAVNYQGITWSPAQNELTQNLLAQYWLPKHPGVRVNTFAGSGSNGPNQGSTSAIAAILAGAGGPDVLSGCCTDFPTYLAAGVLAPLDPWLTKDNIDVHDMFSPGHLVALTTSHGIMALPAYDGPQVLLVDEGQLDRLGLAYPRPDWTLADAERLWEAASGRDAHAPNGWRYGACLQWYVGGWGGYWLPQGWGGNWIDPSRTKSLFASGPALEGFQWIASLFQRKVAIPRGFSGSDGGWGSVQAGQAVMGMAGGWDSLAIATNMRGRKWNYYSMPVFPAGRPTTMINVDFLAMNASSKYPDLAWSLFKFASMDPTYQLFDIRTTLVNPSLVALWPEWERLVQAIAPPMRGKNLQAYQQAVQYGAGHIYFKYEPIQVNNLIGQATNQVPPGGSADVTEVFRQLSQRIDAIQAAGPALAAAAARTVSLWRTYVGRAQAASAPIQFPAPPRSGPGVAATAANREVAFDARTGTYTLTAAGGGGVNGSNDNCLFAGQAYTSSRGTFVCRLLSVAAVHATSVANGAKIGLMARDSLGSEAASVGLEVAMGRGVHFHVRPLDGTNLGDNRPASATQATGLIGSAVILANDAKPARNYLLKPVWLKLVLDADLWTPYTSLDGVTWTQATPPAGVQFVGAWVGLYATSHSPGHQIVATFDHVSGFAPDTFVQIGTP